MIYRLIRIFWKRPRLRFMDPDVPEKCDRNIVISLYSLNAQAAVDEFKRFE
jgi:hypothetical protein